MSRNQSSSRAYAKSVQMSITFPDPIRKAAVAQLLEDGSYFLGVNKGAVASNILEGALIPLSGIEREVFLRCLFSDPYDETTFGEGSVWKSLERAFEYAAADSGSPYRNCGDKYLNLAARLAARHQTTLREDAAGSKSRLELKRLLGSAISDPQELQRLLDDPKPSALPFFKAIIETNAAMAPISMECTSLLILLCASCECTQDTPSDRRELMEACADTQIDRTRHAEGIHRRQEDNVESSFSKVKMAEGRTLVVPDRWILLNPSDADACRYAGYVGSTKTHYGETPICAAFFSEKPIMDMTDEERNDVTELAQSTSPYLAKLKDSEVKLSYNPDGGVANRAEHNASEFLTVYEVMPPSLASNGMPEPHCIIIRE